AKELVRQDQEIEEDCRMAEVGLAPDRQVVAVDNRERIRAVDRLVVPEPRGELHEAEESKKQRQPDNGCDERELPVSRQHKRRFGIGVSNRLTGDKESSGRE